MAPNCAIRSRGLCLWPGQFKEKIPGPRQSGIVVLAAADIGKFIKGDGVLIVILKNFIIVEFDVIVVLNVQIGVIVEDQFLAFFRNLRFRGLVCFVRNQGPRALPGVDLDDLAGIGANHRRAAQVVETFASGGANTFDAPFLFGHDIPFKYSVSLKSVALCHNHSGLSKAFRIELHQAGKTNEDGKAAALKGPPIGRRATNRSPDAQVGTSAAIFPVG